MQFSFPRLLLPHFRHPRHVSVVFRGHFSCFCFSSLGFGISTRVWLYFFFRGLISSRFEYSSAFFSWSVAPSGTATSVWLRVSSFLRRVSCPLRLPPFSSAHHHCAAFVFFSYVFWTYSWFVMFSSIFFRRILGLRLLSMYAR